MLKSSDCPRVGDLPSNTLLSVLRELRTRKRYHHNKTKIRNSGARGRDSARRAAPTTIAAASDRGKRRRIRETKNLREIFQGTRNGVLGSRREVATQLASRRCLVRVVACLVAYLVAVTNLFKGRSNLFVGRGRVGLPHVDPFRDSLDPLSAPEQKQRVVMNSQKAQSREVPSSWRRLIFFRVSRKKLVFFFRCYPLFLSTSDGVVSVGGEPVVSNTN